MAKIESRIQLKKGDGAPEFALPGIDLPAEASAQAGGKQGLLVIFMCNHCPYVKARMAEITALHKEFGSRIAFVGINSSDPEYPGEGMEKMKEFAKERGIAFPYLLDEEGATAKAYGATCTPDPFLFASTISGGTLSERSESKGDFRLVFHGRISDALEPSDTPREFTMRDNIKKLLGGEAIEPWFEPSLGCSIKFKP